MVIKRAAAVAGFCLLAATGSVTQARAEKPVPGAAVPAAADVAARPTLAPTAVGDSAWPITLKEIKGSSKERVWSEQEIGVALARCAVLLKDLDVVAEAENPLREGSGCGNPAPMRLISIGRGAEQVTFSPAPVVTCDLIAGLAQWLQQDVQKLARRHLGGPVVRIDTMSSYSCRNAYGRSGGRISEHGRANALDLGAFHTDKARIVSVEADWGVTQREIAAARQKSIEKGDDAQPLAAAMEMAKAGVVAPPHAATAKRPETAAAVIAPAPAGLLDLKPSIPGIMLSPGGTMSSGFGFDQVSRLGGPKPRNAAAAYIPAVPPPSRPAAVSVNKAEFLHAAHKAGCRIFGTVLGPEANKTHRNHFHVDMAERAQNTKVCE